MPSQPIEADLLFVNGNVLTMDPGRPRACAVAVAGGRIGRCRTIPPGAGGEVVDLGGATLLPGFHDAHNHMAWFGMSLAEVDLRPPASQPGRAVCGGGRRAQAAGPGEWVVGSGYDQNKTGGHPDRDTLDRIAPGRRVWLRHTSGHMCVVNSPVLEDLGMADGRRPTCRAAGW